MKEDLINNVNLMSYTNNKSLNMSLSKSQKTFKTQVQFLDHTETAFKFKDKSIEPDVYRIPFYFQLPTSMPGSFQCKTEK